MADVAGGRIVWNLDVDDSKFNSQLAAAGAKANTLGNTFKSIGGGLSSGLGSIVSWAGEVNNRLHGVVDAAAGVAGHFKIVGIVAAAGLGLAAKASLDMVSSVQKSTLALTTYTGSAQSAAAITKELIDFAKSPSGVLFNRDELLQSTVLLKGAGVETGKLTEYIKAMAPAVAVSGRSFSEIAQILSKVVATGKLGSVEFDQLAERGVVLDKKLRGTAISAADLFKKLQERIPANQLEKYANTVDGIKIRFKTAFRDIGNSLLGVQYGVNEFGASFAPGSLGDKASKALLELTQKLKSTEVTSAMKNLGSSLGDFVTTWMPRLLDALTFLAKHSDEVIKFTQVMIALWATKKALDFADSVATLAARVFQLGVTLLKPVANLAKLVGFGGSVVTISLVVLGLIALDEAGKAVDRFKESSTGAQFQIDKLTERINALPVGPARDKFIALREEMENDKKTSDSLAERYSGLGGALRFVGDGLTDMMFKMLTSQDALGALSRTLLDVTINIAKVGNAFGLVPDQVLADLERTRAAVDGKMLETKLAATQGAEHAVNGIVAQMDRVPGEAANSVAPTSTLVAASLAPTAGAAAAQAGATVGAVGASLGGVPAVAAGAVRPTAGAVGAEIGRLPGEGDRAGRGLMDRLSASISAHGGGPIGAVKAILKNIKDMLPGSDAKTGPLSTLGRQGRALPERLAEGIRQGTAVAVSAANELADAVSPSLSPSLSPAASGYSGGGGVTNVFNPKQLTQADIDMAANRAAYQQGMSLR